MKYFTPGWRLIYTRPRHEKKVHARLAELNINSYLPVRRTIRAWHDRRKIVNEPLFPSYVFIYLNHMQQYYEGMETDGALYYVRSGKEIAMVSDAVVNNIKLVAENAAELEVLDTRFLPGQKLVIAKGALTGLNCEVVDVANKQRLLVRVDLLQRNILLTLPEDALTII